MPGFWGSHLGLIDLELEFENDRWRVAAAHVEARPIYARADRIVTLKDGLVVADELREAATELRS